MATVTEEYLKNKEA